MKSPSAIPILAIAVALLLLCGFIVSWHESLLFLAVAASIVILCVRVEFHFLAPQKRGIWLFLLGGIGRGGAVGLGFWLAIMVTLSFFEDVGDKFPIVVIFFSPLALALGGVSGGLARLLSLRSRSIKA